MNTPLSREYLLKRGNCCNNNCINCPYKKKIMSKTETPSKNLNNEKCVSCNGLTPYTKLTSIYKREYYIEGGGQLCKKCYVKIYK